MKKVIIILLLVTSAYAADKPYRIINSFNAGELSPLLGAREDLSKYHSGCSQIENMFPLPQGAAQKRPGTKYIATAKDSNYPVRLIPFEYSTDQSYVIEFGHEYGRFFTDGAQITSGTGTEDSTDANIIALWGLNENTDSNVVSDACDTYNGVLTDGNSQDIHSVGKVGSGCFNFDNYGGCVKVDDAANFTFAETNSPFSLTAWIFVEDTSEVQTIISKWNEATPAREWRLQLLSDETLKFELYDNSLSIGSDCVSQWKLNEDAATTTVVDTQGLVNGTGTANTDALHIDGKIEGAFDLDGQYAVYINDNNGYSFTNNTQDEEFSLAMWVYAPDPAHGYDDNVLSKWNTNNYEWRIYLDNYLWSSNRYYLILHDESASKSIWRYSSTSSTEGWHFLTVTYDGSEAYTGINWYIDGESANGSGSKESGYGAMQNGSAKVAIGASYTSGVLNDFYHEKIDNVMIFDKELSSSEVSGLYASGSGTEDLVGDSVYITSDSSLDTGFRFVAATYDSTGGATTASGMELYVDGSAVSTTDHNYASYVAMENTTADLRIGSQLSTTSEEQYVFSNRLDAVSIYNKELSAANVSSLYDSGPFEIETPYETNEPFDIQYTQSADVLFISHPNYAPRQLERYADNWWEFKKTDFYKGPFLDENTTDITITPSALIGTITLTASSPIFSPNDVGSIWQIVHTTDANETTGSHTAAAAASSSITVQKGRSYYYVTHGTWVGTVILQRSYDDGKTWKDVLPHRLESDGDNVTTSGTEDDGDALYRVYMKSFTSGSCDYCFVAHSFDIEGVVEITSYTNATSVTGTVKNAIGSVSATDRWSEGAWSPRRGYPRTVTFFEDRLFYGGNDYKPDTIWGSAVGDYNSMDAGSDDDEAVAFTLSSRQINAIRWLVGKNKLLIGTSGAEWSMAGSGEDEPITPSNVKAEQQSVYGSAELQAILANESVLFFQRGAKKMRELAYNWELDSYVAPDMTILAKEVTGDGVTDTAFQQTPDSILWCVVEDGNLATFSYERKEEIAAWSRQSTEGDFESVAQIHGDPEDEIWVSVKRTIDGNDYRYIEQFQPREYSGDSNAFFVDCGATYTNTNEITDLTWLEGESVLCLADGAVVSVNDVNSGTVSLGATYSVVQIGLPYTVQLKTMPLSWIVSGMTIQSRIKRINGLVPRWYKSGDFYYGWDSDHISLLSISGVTTGEPNNWKTFPPGYSREGYVYIYQQSPEPLTLLSLLIEFMVY